MDMLPASALLHGFGLPSLVIFFLLGSLILSVVLGVWIYRDAQSRGLSGPMWLIVLFVTNLIGLIIYLIVRNDYQQGMKE